MTPLLFPLGIFVSVILIWFFFRSGGYKRHPLDAPPPGSDWGFTGERFVDPPTGEKLEVWYCARTGERAYVRAEREEAFKSQAKKHSVI